MRTVFIFFATVMALIAIAAGSAQAQTITFDKTSHDFGTIHADKPVTTEFEFTNTGGDPLVIISARASCGCTKPKYPQEPIAPGQKGKIEVTFTPNSQRGETLKTVTVKSNDPAHKRVSLKITSVVVD